MREGGAKALIGGVAQAALILRRRRRRPRRTHPKLNWRREWSTSGRRRSGIRIQPFIGLDDDVPSAAVAVILLGKVPERVTGRNRVLGRGRGGRAPGSRGGDRRRPVPARPGTGSVMRPSSAGV